MSDGCHSGHKEEDIVSPPEGGKGEEKRGRRKKSEHFLFSCDTFVTTMSKKDIGGRGRRKG